MSRLHRRLEDELHALAGQDRRRTLRIARGVDCSSNDYLGLSRHPALLEAMRSAAETGIPAGAGGARLLSGTFVEHLEAEALFAAFVGRERSLLFGSGFLANMALLSAVPTRHDLLLLDSAAHASLKEGARASTATRRTFRHNDLADLQRGLRDRERFNDVFIVVEGIYSMDGDAAPLDALMPLAVAYDAHVIVDEAHATGLFGENLRGVHDRAGLAAPLATVHPCGKALGAFGAFVAADAVLAEYLVNTARPFLFSTAMPPASAAVLCAAVGLIPHIHEDAHRLLARAAMVRERLGGLRRWRLGASVGPIIPVIVGEAAEAVRAADLLMASGFDVRPIRPPTVPPGTSRLRISLTTAIDDRVAGELADAIINAECAIESGTAHALNAEAGDA